MNPVPYADPQLEARRLHELARTEGLTVRLLGGVAVALAADGQLPVPLQRDYKDLDYVVLRKDALRWDQMIVEAGYEADTAFNTLHGSQRQLHFDRANNKQLDTFVGEFAMCHVLNLEARLPVEGMTLSPVDLLLTKLQIIEVNEKDLVDTIALLLTHAVGTGPNKFDKSALAQIVGKDWGWYTTLSDNLTKVLQHLPSVDLPSNDYALVQSRTDQLMAAMQDAPKSLKWRARAKIGRRIPWYDLPEEVE